MEEDFLAILYRFVERICHQFTKIFSFENRSLIAPIKILSSFNERSYIRIMVYGDSNSFRPDSIRKSWPRILQNKNRFRLRVFNESYDGRTTRYDSGERNGLKVIKKKLTANAPLDYVVIMLGTNDVKNKYGPPGPAEIAKGMRQILEIIDSHGSGAKPILLTPPPLGHVISGELAGAQLRISSVVAEYRQLAMNCHIRLIDIHAILETSTDLESDMIHLSKVGRKKVANTVWANLQGVNPYYE